MITIGELVLTHEENLELQTRMEAVQRVDQIVGKPQLLQRCSHLFQARNLFDHVPAEAEDLEVAQGGQRDHLIDRVRAQRQMLHVDKAVQRRIHLLDGRGQTTQQNLCRLLDRAVRIVALPDLDSLRARSPWHRSPEQKLDSPLQPNWRL